MYGGIFGKKLRRSHADPHATDSTIPLLSWTTTEGTTQDPAGSSHFVEVYEEGLADGQFPVDAGNRKNKLFALIVCIILLLLKAHLIHHFFFASDDDGYDEPFVELGGEAQEQALSFHQG